MCNRLLPYLILAVLGLASMVIVAALPLAYLVGVTTDALFDRPLPSGKRVVCAGVVSLLIALVGVEIEIPAGASGYLVLTDVWFPGWVCTVDGQPSRIYRADYLFRAVEVPPGSRAVVFHFEPVSYLWGRRISACALVLVLAIIAWGWWKPSRQTNTSLGSESRIV